MKTKPIVLIALLITGCNADSTTPSQQNNIQPFNPVIPIPIIEPLPVPVTPISPIESITPPIESIVVYPPLESLIFYPPIESLVPPIESLVIIPPIESLIMRKTYFKPFYPAGCIVNNKESGIVGTCECIQDPVTKDIWYTNSTMIPDTWAITNYLVQRLNNDNACGLSEKWNLPGLDQLSQLNSLLIDVPAESKAAWMNNNGFYNVRNILYFGTMATSPYAYGMNITNGNIIDDINTITAKGWGLAVNSNNQF